MATLNGTIQPPPPTWDPYAPPAAGTGGLLGQDPNLSAPGPFVMPPFVTQAQRFLRDVSIDFHWFAGQGSGNQLGITDVDLASSFSLPLGYNVQTPLIVTPGFSFHFWDGPASSGPLPADMPPQTFDAFLDTAWQPQFNPMFGADLDVRVGYYSDFRLAAFEDFRLIAKGEGVITVSPSIKIKAGVWYLDRVQVKILPAGGIVWTPNPDTEFNILFPNPKLSQRLTTVGVTQWWWYVSGDYGGGTWGIEREVGPDKGHNDLVDYDDIRIALGLEFRRPTGFTGHFEVGGAFDRQLVYQSQQPQTFQAANTVFLRTGVSF
jgi:hypothetical protein